MKLITAKTAAEVKIPGVRVELTEVDNAITGAKLTDKNGSVLAIFTMLSYSFTVQIPAPIETEDAFLVEGTAFSLPLKATFKTEREANEKRSSLMQAASDADEQADLKVSAVTIEKPDTTISPIDDDQELPF